MKTRILLAALCVVFATFVARAADDPPLLKKGTPAPDFTAYKADGVPVKLSDFKGKLVLVDFWATWCQPCRASMPHLEGLHQKFGPKGLVVLGVCVSDTQEAFDRWQKTPQVPTTYLKVFDRAAHGPNGVGKARYQVSSIPTFYLVDKDGKVLFAASGFGGAGDHRLDDALAKAGL